MMDVFQLHARHRLVGVSVLAVMIVFCFLASSSAAFGPIGASATRTIRTCRNSQRNKVTRLWSDAIEGDPIRAATGIRPSLHPVTINALADILRQRAQDGELLPRNDSKFTENPALIVAQVAGEMAMEAIAKRQSTSTRDGMMLTPEEQQTVAGRVLGVVMRLDELERCLLERCNAVSWVTKYQMWSTFGVLGPEEESTKLVEERIVSDPLFRMNRAECLLALFLNTVEAPALEASSQEVPGGSDVDFIDAEKKEVLLPS